MSLASLHAAAMAALLTADPKPCWLCGAPLHTVPNPATDLFEPVDHAGSPTGTDADLAHLFDPAANPLHATSPYDALNKMAALMTDPAADKAVRAGKAEHTALHWRVAQEYSMLRVRLDTGMSFHVHREPAGWDPARAAERIGRPRPADLPYHCGWPAWLRPSGWHCRQCRIVLTDETREE